MSAPRDAARRDGRVEQSRATNDAVHIGRRLRAARHRRGLSIAALAEASGLTKGFISQLERDLTTASVASLIRICDALGIPVGTLFEPSRTTLIRHDDRPRINFGGERVREWLLTPAQSSDLQVIQSEIDPGGGSGDEPYCLDIDVEWVHVLEGELTIVAGDERYELGTGDSLQFSARTPHAWRNPSAERAARVLWILAHPRRGLGLGA